MPFCPVCGVEYRDGFERCSDCDAALVPVAPALRSPGPGEDWVAVASFPAFDEALFARGLLLEQGLDAEVVPPHEVRYPFTREGEPAGTLVLVPPAAAEQAQAVLAAAEAGNDLIDEEEPVAPGEPV